ncbi:MAG: hypothetical protein WC877_00350 [Dehalococcoidales bacterium]|jgi:hypothetical protein
MSDDYLTDTVVKFPPNVVGRFIGGRFIPEGSDLKVFIFECNECSFLQPCRYSRVSSDSEVDDPINCPNCHAYIPDWSRVEFLEWKNSSVVKDE